MSTVDEIKAAIEQLTFEQRAELARWMHGWENDEWDQELVVDAKSGKLDKLLKEVDEDIKAGRLRDLP